MDASRILEAVNEKKEELWQEVFGCYYAALCSYAGRLVQDPVIAEDAVNFFQNMLMGDLYSSYQKLLVAPFTMKDHLLRMIDGEIARGQKGHIIIKVNSVTERELIDKLAQASQAGVRVELIVRGTCCLLPGIPGKTENITITSIVGRFLEHSRIYVFGEGDGERMYISSADFMTRNTERRVEVACPVYDKKLRERIHGMIDAILGDNVKARLLMPDGEYVKKDAVGPSLDSQEFFMEQAVKSEEEAALKKQNAPKREHVSAKAQQAAAPAAPKKRGVIKRVIDAILNR